MLIIKNFKDFLNESRYPYETGESNCCGAPIMQGGICSACNDHCEPEEEDGYPEDQMTDHEFEPRNHDDEPGSELPNVEGF
jgi:hypothetical protein